jgi:pimeloyl-ACP methyl ester carboxylesterase
MGAVSIEGFAGTPIHEAYLSAAPHPEDWPQLIDKTKQLLAEDFDWAPSVAEIRAPTLIVVGDGDGLPPSHAVEMFGLLGGGKADGDLAGLPSAQLAVLPATTHVGWAPPYHGIITRTQLLLTIITEFLDAPLPEDK